MPRYYEQVEYDHMPAWRIVEMPTKQRFYYPDLEHAINGRIIARAWFNQQELMGRQLGWSAFCRSIDYLQSTLTKSGGSRKGSLSGAVSNKLYNNVSRGTLPKDERVRKLLIRLSGYPWK